MLATEIGVYDQRGERTGTKRLTIGEAAALAGYRSPTPAEAAIEGLTLWFALQTEPLRESLAASHLVARDFSCYLPAVATYYAKRGPTPQWRTEPMFRGYLFLRSAEGRVAATLARVRGLPGVIGVVRASGDNAAYAVISPDDIARMREGETRSFERKMAALSKHHVPYEGALKVGDQVRIAEGTFEGHLGRIEELRDEDRITVLVDVFGRATPFTVAARMLGGV